MADLELDDDFQTCESSHEESASQQAPRRAIAKKLAIPSSNVFQLIADLENAA